MCDSEPRRFALRSIMIPSSRLVSSLARLASALQGAALVALTLGAVGGCAEEVGTSIRISLVYKDTWRMGAAEVVLTQDENMLQRTGDIAHELLVLVPDELAGSVMPLEVWGVREGERISHGSAVALLRKGQTVEATVVLDRLPCGVFCMEGDGDCYEGGLRTCVPDDDGCMQWSDAVACPAETPDCSGGVCADGCRDECVAGQGVCVDADTARACGQFDSDACLDLGSETQCTGADVCYSGRCAPPCTQGALTNATVPGTTTAFSTSLAIDAGGTSHAVFSARTTRALYYGARPKGGAWPATWEQLPTISGEAPSLVVDSQGGVHLVAGGAGVVYGYRPPAGPWQVATVQDTTVQATSTAIAVTSNGAPHIIFYDNGAAMLRHATQGTPWAIEDVGAGIGAGVSLAITGEILHVSSFSTVGATNDVWYSVRDATDWTNTMVHDLFGTTRYAAATTAIAADRSGTLHLVYSDLLRSGTATANDDLRYIYKTGASWTAGAIIIDNANTTVGGVPRLTIDPFDRLHVAYRTTTATPTLKYATKDAGSTSWSLAVQPPTTPGVLPAVAADPDGGIHILSVDTSIIESSRSCQ